MKPESMEERIARVIAQSEQLRNLCAQYLITIRPYLGCTGVQYYEATSVIQDRPVVSVSESKIDAVEDVVWKLKNGWGEGEVFKPRLKTPDTPPPISKAHSLPGCTVSRCAGGNSDAGSS